MSDEKKFPERSGEHRPAHREDGEKRPFRSGKPFGDRNDSKGAGKPYGRPGFGGKPTPRGERKADGGDKPAFRGDKPAFRGDKPAFRGDKPAFRGDKPAFRGDKPAFRGDKPAFRGDKPAFRGDRKPASGEFHRERPMNRPENVENRPVGGDKPAFTNDFEFKGGDRPRTIRVENRRPMGGSRPAFRKDGMRPAARPAVRRDAPAKERPGTTDGMPARRIALDVIRNVTENGAYASLYLDEKLLACGLSLADRRLVSRLVYETLERLMTIDHALSQVMAREDTDVKLRNILRLGACQILFMDRIPESAATNTCVNLCKELGMEGLAGVCNGILRNLIRQKDELTWPDPVTEPLRARAVKYSVPEWLVEQLTADWGEAEADALMGAHEEVNDVTVRPNLLRLNDEAFEKLLDGKVWEWRRGTVPHSYHIRGLADVSRDSDFSSGNFSIQGESSMMAAMAVDPRRGWHVLDACSAPGGKTCLMAEMMGDTGRVQAWEVREHRTDLVAAQQKRLHIENIRPMTRDALKLREDMIETMDAVLLDAPCSGTGDMLEKPDVRYRVKPENVAELADTQRRLLDTVSQYVKRGGVLVYSTCSVLKAENEQQVAAFLERNPEFVLDKLPASIPEQFAAQSTVGLQLMPHRDHVGGFYICRMRRKR